jgi:hypothetical protein
MSGFIILDVTSISYVKVPNKKTGHDAHLTSKFGNEKNNFDYSCEGIFHRQHIRHIYQDCGHAFLHSYQIPKYEARTTCQGGP